MSKINLAIFTLLVAGTFFTACSQFESGSGSSASGRTISGKSQKGPFTKGTKVTLYGMDEKLQQTGAHFSTEIDNDRGEYSLKNIDLDDRYAWLNANGYFTSELSGFRSEQMISLNSLVDLQDLDHVNINVLTHLSFDRIRYLVKQGKTVGEAKKQAEKEVMAAFGFSEETEAFDQLDILNNTEGDAKLLAISLIMLTGKDMGEVANTLAEISLDLEKDGTWDDTVLIRRTKDLVSMDYHDGVFDDAKVGLEPVYDYDSYYTYYNGGHDTTVPNIKEWVQVAEVPDFKKFLKQFASPWDSVWGHCSTQDEVRRTTHFEEKERVICRDGVWMGYGGERDEGDPPVDTTGKYGSFVDERDGMVYKTLDVELKNGDTATWMASLLEYDTKNGDDTVSRWGNNRGEMYSKGMTSYRPGVGRGYTVCQIFGLSAGEKCEFNSSEVRLKKPINLNKNVQGICPDGWHVPNNQEWDQMADAIKDDLEMLELMRYPQYPNPEQKAVYHTSFYSNYTIEPGDDPSDDSRDKIGVYVSRIRDERVPLLGLNDGDILLGLRCVKN